jgi:hypothetical protein
MGAGNVLPGEVESALSADFGDRRSVLDLLQRQGNLLILKTTLSHGLIFPF